MCSQLLFQQYEIKAPTNIFKKNALLPKVKTDIEKMTFNRIGNYIIFFFFL